MGICHNYWACWGFCPPPFYPGYNYYPPYDGGDYNITNYYDVSPLAGAQNLPPTDPTPQAKPKPPPTVDDWIKDLKNPDSNVRGRAVEALAQLGPAAAKAVPALIEVLKDRDPQVRVEATQALAAIGTGAIGALVDALKESNKYVRMGAALTLGHLGTAAQTAVPALRTTLKDKDVRVRCHAAPALWRIDHA